MDYFYGLNDFIVFYNAKHKLFEVINCERFVCNLEISS